jgi:hypothetical protein
MLRTVELYVHPPIYLDGIALIELNAGRTYLLQSLGMTPWKGDQPVTRPLPPHNNTNNEITQTSLPRVGFKHTIPVFEQTDDMSCLISCGQYDQLSKISTVLLREEIRLRTAESQVLRKYLDLRGKK